MACMIFNVSGNVSYLQEKSRARAYKQYSDSSLQEAVRQVQSGQLSIRNASSKFKIKRSTLHNHVRGIHLKKPGHSTVFSAELQKRNCHW